MWRGKKTDTRLKDGATVAVVGGGPAGCFFTLHLLRYARRRGINVQVTLFEARDFILAGPRNCGKCAGLLSSRLQRNLRSFGMALPGAVIQDKIDSYVLHLADDQAEIFPPLPNRKIITVFRGRGPRLAPMKQEVNFDEWLLSQVKQTGTQVVYQAVQKITAAERPVIQSNNQSQSFDLLVLANGINSRRLSLTGFDYRPPKTKTMIQDELNTHPGSSSRQVHIYFGRPKQVIFGAAVPKGSMTSISLLGDDLRWDAVGKFMEANTVGYGCEQLCGCKPRIAVSMAHGYYDNRFVAVGDAAATRLYKDGIGSAFLTSRQAAYTAIYQGTGKTDFRLRYAPLCRMIALDNFFGWLLFYLWNRIGRMPALTQLWLKTLEYELDLPPKKRRYRRALWNMFTGDDSYRRIFFSLLDPRIAWQFLTVTWRLWMQSKFYQTLKR